MIPFLFTPFGRYITIGVAVLALLFGVYLKIRSDAVADMEAEAQIEIIRRTNEAITAGDSINVSPDRVRDHDKFERD